MLLKVNFKTLIKIGSALLCSKDALQNSEAEKRKDLSRRKGETEDGKKGAK